MTRPLAHAMILLAVLVMIVIGALIAGTVLLFAQGETSGAAVVSRRAQTRAGAWSGVQAVMSELAAQRELILIGESPEITDTWELPGGPGGWDTTVRVVERNGVVLSSENARLDANHATRDMLALLAGVGEAGADAIVRARSGTPFSSVGEVLPLLPRSTAGTEAPDEILLTVFSVDPAVATGVADPSALGLSRDRFVLPEELSPDDEADLTERYGGASASCVRDMAEGQQPARTPRDMVRAMRRAGLPVEEWGALLDAVSPHDRGLDLGRVDLNRADASVLACIPGIDEEAADAIVLRRDKMEPSDLASVTWPVIEGIIDAPAFEEAVSWLTTRSPQWRVTIEAGFATFDDESGDGDEPPLRHRVALEAVIDVSGPDPRLAYLRDVTYTDVPARPEEPADLSDEPEPESTDPDRAEPDGAAPNDDTGNQPAPQAPPLPPANDDPTDDADAGASDTEAGRRIGRWIVPSGSER